MGKIRDGNFEFQHIFATSYSDVFETSANQPLLVLGINMNNGVSGEFVLKPTGAQRMYPGASMKELIASLIALELELSTPEPVNITVEDEFIKSCLGKTFYLTLQRSKGINFGTEYLNGVNSTWSNAFANQNLLIREMQKVFIFDVLIENTDRTPQKPNLLTNGKDCIHIIDHEVAFSFTDLVGYSNETPWILGENETTFFRKHLFYDFLKSKEFYSDLLFDKMLNLDEQFWEKVKLLIPHEWLDEYKFDRIKKYIDSRVEKNYYFKNEVKRLLI